MTITRRDFVKGTFGLAGAVAITGCVFESVRAERRYSTVLDDVYGFGESLIDNPVLLDEDWEKKQAAICTALGDCGPSKNWLGQEGYKKGYKVVISDVDEED